MCTGRSAEEAFCTHVRFTCAAGRSRLRSDCGESMGGTPQVLGLKDWKDAAFHVSAILQNDSAKIRLTRDRDALGAAVGVQTLPAPHAALEAAPEAPAIVYSLIAQRVAIIEANCAVVLQARSDWSGWETPAVRRKRLADAGILWLQ